MSLLCTYVGAARCSGGPAVGARALMAWFLGGYGDRGGTNLGIFLCRVVAGSDTLSLHAEGRANDWGIPRDASWGQGLCDAMIAKSGEIGVQCVIYRGRIWSASYCDQGWRRYGGSDRHDTHAHVELSPGAARTLTVTGINQIMSEGQGTVSKAEVIEGLRDPEPFESAGVGRAATAHGEGQMSLRTMIEYMLYAVRYGGTFTGPDGKPRAIPARLVGPELTNLTAGVTAAISELSSKIATLSGVISDLGVRVGRLENPTDPD